MKFWQGKEILITGGTGTLGKQLVKDLIPMEPKGIRVFSRDEAKHVQMRREFSSDLPIAYLLGDIRDRRRLLRAMQGSSIVIHTAALKQVPIAEENPLEYIRTNVQGTLNVIECCIDAGVEKAMMISTDKAVYPVNLYGATKMCAERAFIHANLYTGGRAPFFSACRYGNVLGSRGSVVQFFTALTQLDPTSREQVSFPITHPDMTRFWFTIGQSSRFILRSFSEMRGGEIFVPKMPSMRVEDLAATIAIMVGREYKFRYIGVRPGEKIHECLITKEESLATVRSPDGYIILQNYRKEVGEPQMVTSDTNDWWLSPSDCMRLLKEEP